MEKHYRRMVKDTDARILRWMQAQCLDPESPRYGGFPEIASGIIHAKMAIYAVADEITGYFNEDSRFFHDKRFWRAWIWD